MFRINRILALVILLILLMFVVPFLVPFVIILIAFAIRQSGGSLFKTFKTTDSNGHHIDELQLNLMSLLISDFLYRAGESNSQLAKARE